MRWLLVEDRSTSKYNLKASFKTIPISDFIHSFSAKLIPKSLHRALKKFIRFRIDNAKLVVPLGTKNPQIHLSGTPVIGGFKTVHMSSIIFRQGKKTYLVQGFQLGKVSLASIIRQITRKDLRRIAFLNQHLNTALVISPVTLPPDLRLYGSQLSDILITKGVSIRALLHWPPNCAQDNFCAVAQRSLGSDAKFTLQGTFVNLQSFTLSAGVSNVRLGSGERRYKHDMSCWTDCKQTLECIGWLVAAICLWLQKKWGENVNLDFGCIYDSCRFSITLFKRSRHCFFNDGMIRPDRKHSKSKICIVDPCDKHSGDWRWRYFKTSG